MLIGIVKMPYQCRCIVALRGIDIIMVLFKWSIGKEQQLTYEIEVMIYFHPILI